MYLMLDTGSDSAWAKQILSMGGSYAEDNSRTSLVTSGYSNSHSGYTPQLPEGRQGGGVYAFANLISHGGTSREGKQVGPARTQQLVETAAPANAPSKPLVPAVKQVAKPGYTAAVREDRARPATKAWDWAEDGEHGEKTTSMSVKHPGQTSSVSESADTAEQKVRVVTFSYDSTSRL